LSQKSSHLSFIPPCWRRRKLGDTVVRFSVRTHPRASRTRLRWDGLSLDLWVTAAPTGGAANQAVIKLIAEWFDVPRSAVRITSGHRHRSKVVEVDGVYSLPEPGDG